MGNEVQGENSSSQNVKLKVSNIERGVHGEIISFGFSNGSSFFIHPEIAIKYSVKIGSSFSIGEIENLQRLSIVFAAREKGIEYLAVREHSSREIINKLKKKGYDSESSLEAVRLLQEKNYLNDERYATMWINSRKKRHPEGRIALTAGLAKKGVPRKIAEKAILENFTKEDEMQSLEVCIKKYLRTKSVNPEKLLNHLIRRGFCYADIKKQITGMEEFANENNIEITEYE